MEETVGIRRQPKRLIMGESPEIISEQGQRSGRIQCNPADDILSRDNSRGMRAALPLSTDALKAFLLFFFLNGLGLDGRRFRWNIVYQQIQEVEWRPATFKVLNKPSVRLAMC